MNKILKRSVLAASMLASTAALAFDDVDNFGHYAIDEIRVNDDVWTDSSTTVVTNTTYQVEIDMSYDHDVFIPGAVPVPFWYDQEATITIDNQIVWYGSDDDPTILDSEEVQTDDEEFEEQINNAEWTLSGDFEYVGEVDPEGVYIAYFDRMPNAPAADGFPGVVCHGQESLFELCRESQEITLVNPDGGNQTDVPEPGSLALLGLGLVGLGIGRRKLKNS